MTAEQTYKPNPLFKLWQILGSDRLLIFWLSCLFVVVILTAWFPQAPRNIYLDEPSFSNWLDSVRPEFGRHTDDLDKNGFFTITRSIWFRILIAGTAFTLLVKLFDALQALTGFPSLGIPAFSRTGLVNKDAQSIIQQADTWLDKRWRKNVTLGSEHTMDDDKVLADNTVSGLEAFRPLSAIGSLCVILGCLTVLTGWYWNDLGGWTYTGIRIHNNSPADAPYDQTNLRMQDLIVTWPSEGTPLQANGTLEIWQEEMIAAGKLSSSQDWRWQGIVFRMDSVGPAVYARGEGPDGNPLALQTTANQPPVDELTLPLSMVDDVKSFAAPDKGIVIQLGLEPAEYQPQVRVRVYQGREGELIINQLIDQSITLEINSSSLHCTIIPFAEISAAYAPGNPLLFIGALLALAGLITCAIFRLRHIKLELLNKDDRTQVTIYAAKLRDAQWLDGLADYLALEFEGKNDD